MLETTFVEDIASWCVGHQRLLWPRVHWRSLQADKRRSAHGLEADGDGEWPALDQGCQNLRFRSKPTEVLGSQGEKEKHLVQPCVFGDLMDRVPSEHRKKLTRLVSSADGSNDAELYADATKYIQQHSGDIFGPLVECDCLVHKKKCRVHPSRDSFVRHIDPPEEMRKPLVFNMAGTTCVGWSRVGLRKRHADPSELFHSVWLEERRASAFRNIEDAFWSECVTTYPAATKLQQELSGTHEVIFVHCSPEDPLPLLTQRAPAPGREKSWVCSFWRSVVQLCA